MTIGIGHAVRETTATTGTVTSIDLAGKFNNSYQTFVEAGLDVYDEVPYLILDGLAREVGRGSITDGSPDTLSRDTVLYSTNSNNRIDLSGNDAVVSCVLPGDTDFIVEMLDTYPANPVSGCVPSINGTDGNHDLDFTAGRLVDTAETTIFRLSALTKAFDTAFAAGNNQGGALQSATLTDTVASDGGASSTTIKGVDLSDATVTEVDNTSGNISSNTTTPTFNYPTGQTITAGQLLIWFYSADGSWTVTGGDIFNDWTEVDTTENTTGEAGVTLSIWSKIADGTETGTFGATISSSEKGSYVVLVYDAGTGVAPSVGGTPAVGTSSEADPPNHNPGATYTTTYFSVIGLDRGDATLSAWGPTTYDRTYESAGGGGAGVSHVAVAAKDATGQAFNPSSVTISSSMRWVATTCSIIPGKDYSANSTTFLTDFQAGDLIYFETAAAYRRVTAVTDDNTLTISEAITIVTPENYKRHGGLGDANSDGGEAHIFALFNPTTEAVDLGMSRRLTPVDLPSGFTKYQRVCTPSIDASDDFDFTISFESSGGGLTMDGNVPTGIDTWDLTSVWVDHRR